ncbi:MAG: SDR family oxidoreductase, partial [Bacteroidota bacterium]
KVHKSNKMDLGIKDRIIIVTGGAKGIGASIVKGISKEGGIPIIVGRSEKVGKLLADEIAANGGQAYNIVHELGKGNTCKEIVEEIIDEFGSIYGLVNNAGFNDSIGLENGSPDQFMSSIQTNLSHYYDMAHYCCPYLKRTKGAIVNISSKTALTGQGNSSGYAASNGAQLALTREWAVELAPFKIRVNAIVPAEVMTPQYQKWITTFQNHEEVLDEIKLKVPLGQRMTDAEEIAHTCLFLLSDKSLHTTGQWLFVDGGYVHLDRAMNGQDSLAKSNAIEMEMENHK